MKSISDQFIIAAVEKGYTADRQGNIYNPNGKVLSNKSSKSAGHLSVTIRVEGINDRGWQSVLAHRLIAYFFYGDSLFNCQCVRHLNDIPNDNRLDNLALGSFKENRADIPREIISTNAKRNAHLLIKRSRKLSDEQILRMRKMRKENNTPYHKLAEEFGVTAMTAHRACNGKAWIDIKESN